MKGIYHYAGMSLHFLSTNSNWAVYYRKPKDSDKPKDKYNPYRVYAIKQVYSASNGWQMQHKLLDKYADLTSAVMSIRELQCYL